MFWKSRHHWAPFELDDQRPIDIVIGDDDDYDDDDDDVYDENSVRRVDTNIK